MWQLADQTARTTAPATRFNDVARIGQFRPFPGLMNFVTTPGGFIGKREPQTILKNGRAQHPHRVKARGTIQPAKSIGWGENRDSLEGDKLEAAVKNGRWLLTHLPAGPRPAAELPRYYFPGD